MIRESAWGHLRRIQGAGAVSGAPPIATCRRAAIRAAVRSNTPLAEIAAPFLSYENWDSFGVVMGDIMKFPRRQFLHLAAGAAALPAASRIARAQAYPSRPITMIVPFPVGGANDVIARIVAERMRAPLGRPIIIENVTGAEGSVGVGRAARARPDGYTICLSLSAAHVLNSAFYSLPYDVLNDFAPIAALATVPTVLAAGKTLPAKDLSELVAWLTANPNRASAGMNGLGYRLTAKFFQQQTGTQFTIVPYRAAAELFADEVAGRIDFVLATLFSQLPLLRARSVRVYAVTSDTRSALAHDIPTFAEMGLPALIYSDWFGLFAPKGTSKQIIAKLNTAVVETLDDPALRSLLTDLGYEIFPRERQTPQAFAALQNADAEKWWPIIKELGLKAE
jgi:tripartite-type tricarboxylate transporter receptor subunit TctC